MYEQASAWTADLVRGAKDQLDKPTPCDEWNVKTLISHLIDTQHYFTATAKGQEASPPGPNPPDLAGADPAQAFDSAREEALAAFSNPADAEKVAFGVGIAFSDALLHGWDLATATGQDATMPDGLAQKAYETIHGKFTDEQRKGIFKPEVKVADDASPQEKLLAYTGRTP